MTNLLIGSEATIDVPCKALFQSAGSKPIQSTFIAVYTRLSRSASKERNKALNEFLREIRSITKEILLLDHDNISLDDNDKIVLVINENADDFVLLTEEKREAFRVTLENKLDNISKKMDEQIINNLHNIKNLELSNKKIAEFSPELVAEMLESEPYFIALREGLRKSNGVYEEARTKNS